MSLFAAIDRRLEMDLARQVGVQLRLRTYFLVAAKNWNKSLWDDWKATKNPDACTHPKFTFDFCRQAWICCYCDTKVYRRSLFDTPGMAEHIHQRCDVSPYEFNGGRSQYP